MIVTRAMQKFIDIGANVRFFNTCVYVDKVARTNGFAELSENPVTPEIEPPEPADATVEFEPEVEQETEPSEPDEPTVVVEPEVAQETEPPESVDESTKNFQQTGKCPFYLKGRKPKNVLHGQLGSKSDSRRFTF